MKYQVIVGNVGTTLDTDNGAAALVEYGQWKQKSLSNEGRAAGEPVTLMRDGEPWHEHQPGIQFKHIDSTFDEHDKEWEAYCANSGFMKPVIEKARYAVIETNQGTWIVPADVCNSGDPQDYRDYVEGEIEEDHDPIELKLGWLARLSAPGYMDCTAWSVHETAKEAQAYLMETYFD